MDYEIINIIYMVMFFIIGTLFGSFFSLAVYRIPKKQDILVKRSYCPNCEHELGFFDLIPIVSYILRRGKCKYCSDKISLRYLFLELFNGLFFLITYLLIGIHWILFATLAIYIALVLVVGSSIMKKKMQQENNLNLSTKSGIFNIELLVAVVAFTIYYVITIFTTRNYANTLDTTKLRSDAMNLAVNIIEENKGKGFSNIVNYSGEKEIDGRKFIYDLEVVNYTDKNGTEGSITAKRIISTVKYSYLKKQYDVSFETAVFEE